jgi:hypothetical protein
MGAKALSRAANCAVEGGGGEADGGAEGGGSGVGAIAIGVGARDVSSGAVGDATSAGIVVCSGGLDFTSSNAGLAGKGGGGSISGSAEIEVSGNTNPLRRFDSDSRADWLTCGSVTSGARTSLGSLRDKETAGDGVGGSRISPAEDASGTATRSRMRAVEVRAASDWESACRAAAPDPARQASAATRIATRHTDRGKRMVS